MLITYLFLSIFTAGYILALSLLADGFNTTIIASISGIMIVSLGGSNYIYLV